MTLRIKTFVLALLSVLVITACSTSTHDSHMDMDGIDFSVYDQDAIMFAQMMIPHHEQAVEMADMALSNTTNPVILELAAEIKAAQDPEIEQMRGWLDTAGAVEEGAEMHMMHMSGMLSEEELDALRNARDAEFDRLFLEGMIEHHEGAIDMAEDVLENENSEVKALAAAIIEAQTREIELMESLLAELS